MTAIRYGFLFENVLELNTGDGCTTLLSIHKTTEFYSLKMVNSMVYELQLDFYKPILLNPEC